MYSYNYIICIIAQIILAAIVWNSAYMDERKNRFYLFAIIFNILTLVGYLGRGAADTGHYIALNYASNFLIYSSAGLSGYCLLLSNVKKNSVFYYIASVLETINLLILFSSPWTHMSFVIDANGQYQRGRGYVWDMMIPLVFLIVWFYSLMVMYKFVEFKKRVYILLLALLEISAVILQTLDGNFKVIYVAGAFLLAIYYAFMMEVDGRYDQMTGVYSKRFYYAAVERLSRESTYMVVMLDANGLKKINDTKGHDAGDLTIEAVGQATWRILSPQGNVFRIGGDEFVGISTTLSCDRMEKCVEQIHGLLAAKSQELGFEITASIGYTVHEAGEEYAQTLHRADEIMYKNKARYYAEHGEVYGQRK